MMMMNEEDTSSLESSDPKETKTEPQKPRHHDKHIFVDDLVESLGGRYKLAALLITRSKQLISGAPPLTNLDGEPQSVISTALKEARENKIEFSPRQLTEPEPKKKRSSKKS